MSWGKVACAVACGAAGLVDAASGQGAAWRTIVNNGQLMPGSDRPFSSYSPGSVNERGLVVFRARSRGPGQPIRGLYAFDLASSGPSLLVVGQVGGEVPPPNNTEYPPGSGSLATFTEFPAFPRIDRDSDLIVTRGQSRPVWTYLLEDGSETRVGVAGVYAWTPDGLVTAASLLGAVTDAEDGSLVFPWWQVPGAGPGTRFDQFPGSPTATGDLVAFKGNFTDADTGLGQTGIFFRRLSASGAPAAVEVVARSGMPIPGTKIPFGSTSPPSAADGLVVFLGLDNEEAPTAGGIYLAPLEPLPELTALVRIGDPVPGEVTGTATFNRLGEALSFDGRWLAFWGAWGEETFVRTLTCPTDGQEEVIAICNKQYPDGFDVEIPVNQGIFALDLQSGEFLPIAKTGVKGVQDFLYWVFSGSPGTGGEGHGGEGLEDKGEGPRWRSSAFLAIDGFAEGAFRAAFKASIDGTDAILTRVGPAPLGEPVLIAVGGGAEAIDPDAPEGSVITALGIERDSVRADRIIVTASMESTTTKEPWAGQYEADLPPVPSCLGDLNGDGAVSASDLTVLLAEWDCEGACSADLDTDGIVDGVDLAIMLAAWGGCPVG